MSTARVNRNIRYIFGFEPPLVALAAELEHKTLLGQGGPMFVHRLEEALADPDATFTWAITDDFLFDEVLADEGWYFARDILNCRYTNWEMLTFRDRPELWPRTRWVYVAPDGRLSDRGNPMEAELA